MISLLRNKRHKCTTFQLIAVMKLCSAPLSAEFTLERLPVGLFPHM